MSAARSLVPRISRRAAIGAAVVGGAGVAAIRLLAFRSSTSGPASGWQSPLGDERAQVAHLLRRVTFGATPAELEKAQSDGYQKTVDRLLDSPPAEPPDYFGGRPASTVNPAKLQLWWVNHMLATPTPFAERMTLFWHGHFTSDYRKVGAQTPFILWQNLTWRRMATTDLRSMLLEVTRDPGMLRYLDLASSTGANPNENYARELMELFTMGLHYTEDDVRAAAKALAGWMEPPPDGSTTVVLGKANAVSRRYGTWQAQRPGVFNARRAYRGGQLKLLGATRQWDTEQVIDQILAQPWTATFIAGKLARELVSAAPDAAYVSSLADTFRKSRYDVKTLLRAIFQSPEFLAAGHYRGLVKSPTEFTVHTLKALQAPQLAPLAVAAGQGLGQVLFDPPDVGGWPVNEAWISSNTVISRVNYVTDVLRRLPRPPSATSAAATHLDGVLSPATQGLLDQARDDARRWLLVLASPEFQLK